MLSLNTVIGKLGRRSKRGGSIFGNEESRLHSVKNMSCLMQQCTSTTRGKGKDGSAYESFPLLTKKLRSAFQKQSEKQRLREVGEQGPHLWKAFPGQQTDNQDTYSRKRF
mmetsp:Transcript_32584/g.127808  ORF Transcript_32584/g.127808 Transcript_32584/m.127808 type:complete len:110 (+) Transcript_32584:566-895(+)